MDNFQEELEDTADKIESKLNDMNSGVPNEYNYEYSQGACRRQANGLYNQDLVTYHGQMSFGECQNTCSSYLDCAAFSHIAAGSSDAAGVSVGDMCTIWREDPTSPYYGDGHDGISCNIKKLDGTNSNLEEVPAYVLDAFGLEAPLAKDAKYMEGYLRYEGRCKREPKERNTIAILKSQSGCKQECDQDDTCI